MLLPEAIDQYLRHLDVAMNRSPATISQYRVCLARLVDHLGPNYPVGSISTADVDTWREALAGNPRLGAAGLAYHLGALQYFLKWLAARAIASLDPGQVVFQAPPRATRSYLTGDQVHQLHGSFSDDLIGRRGRLIVALLAGSGLRAAELISLDRDWPGLADGEGVLRGKGQKDRPVYVGPWGQQAAADYLELRDDSHPALIVNHHNCRVDRLSRAGLGKIVKEAGQAAGLPKTISPHTLRHTFATNMLKGGTNIYAIQQMMGHSSISTTEQYFHLTNDNLGQIYRAAAFAPGV